MGRFLSNIYDHRRPDAERLLCDSHEEWQAGPKAMRLAWQRHLNWIAANVIGPPQATETRSVAQLEAMGMIGLYALDESPPTAPAGRRVE